ncbi:MAG: hypothetical protein ABL999_18530 [Pyrinomonadaceae bacterium]
MNITDLVIIYLACGSPFAVFQATNRQKGRAGVNWTRVFTSFLLWPVFAISLLVNKIFPNEASRKVEFQNRIEDLRLDFEQVAFTGESISSLFEFRETFYRFVGLSEAVDEVQSGKANAEIFEISGHNNRSLASRCLARKNVNRLSFHRSAAREEFVGLISQLTETGADRIEIASLALELADHLHDQLAADAFHSMISAYQTQDGEWTSGLENEVWKSRTPSTSTIN